MIAGRAMATVESGLFGRWRLPLKAMDSCRKSQLSIVPLLLMWSASYSLAWLLEEVVPAPPRPAALGTAPQYCHSRQSTSRDSIRWHCASFWRTVAAIVVHCAAVPSSSCVGMIVMLAACLLVLLLSSTTRVDQSDKIGGAVGTARLSLLCLFP